MSIERDVVSSGSYWKALFTECPEKYDGFSEALATKRQRQNVIPPVPCRSWRPVMSAATSSAPTVNIFFGVLVYSATYLVEAIALDGKLL
jgi:hypothetical protein